MFATVGDLGPPGRKSEQSKGKGKRKGKGKDDEDRRGRERSTRRDEPPWTRDSSTWRERRSSGRDWHDACYDSREDYDWPSESWESKPNQGYYTSGAWNHSKSQGSWARGSQDSWDRQEGNGWWSDGQWASWGPANPPKRSKSQHYSGWNRDARSESRNSNRLDQYDPDWQERSSRNQLGWNWPSEPDQEDNAEGRDDDGSCESSKRLDESEARGSSDQKHQEPSGGSHLSEGQDQAGAEDQEDWTEVSRQKQKVKKSEKPSTPREKASGEKRPTEKAEKPRPEAKGRPASKKVEGDASGRTLAPSAVEKAKDGSKSSGSGATVRILTDATAKDGSLPEGPKLQPPLQKGNVEMLKKKFEREPTTERYEQAYARRVYVQKKEELKQVLKADVQKEGDDMHKCRPGNWELGSEGIPYVCVQCHGQMPEDDLCKGICWGKEFSQRVRSDISNFFKYCREECFIDSEIAVANQVERQYAKECTFNAAEEEAFTDRDRRASLWKDNKQFCEDAAKAAFWMHASLPYKRVQRNTLALWDSRNPIQKRYWEMISTLGETGMIPYTDQVEGAILRFDLWQDEWNEPVSRCSHCLGWGHEALICNWKKQPRGCNFGSLPDPNKLCQAQSIWVQSLPYWVAESLRVSPRFRSTLSEAELKTLAGPGEEFLQFAKHVSPDLSMLERKVLGLTVRPLATFNRPLLLHEIPPSSGEAFANASKESGSHCATFRAGRDLRPEMLQVIADTDAEHPNAIGLAAVHALRGLRTGEVCDEATSNCETWEPETFRARSQGSPGRGDVLSQELVWPKKTFYEKRSGKERPNYHYQDMLKTWDWLKAWEDLVEDIEHVDTVAFLKRSLPPEWDYMQRGPPPNWYFIAYRGMQSKNGCNEGIYGPNQSDRLHGNMEICRLKLVCLKERDRTRSYFKKRDENVREKVTREAVERFSQREGLSESQRKYAIALKKNFFQDLNRMRKILSQPNKAARVNSEQIAEWNKAIIFEDFVKKAPEGYLGDSETELRAVLRFGQLCNENYAGIAEGRVTTYGDLMACEYRLRDSVHVHKDGSTSSVDQNIVITQRYDDKSQSFTTRLGMAAQIDVTGSESGEIGFAALAERAKMNVDALASQLRSAAACRTLTGSSDPVVLQLTAEGELAETPLQRSMGVEEMISDGGVVDLAAIKGAINQFVANLKEREVLERLDPLKAVMRMTLNRKADDSGNEEDEIPVKYIEQVASELSREYVSVTRDGLPKLGYPLLAETASTQQEYLPVLRTDDKCEDEEMHAHWRSELKALLELKPLDALKVARGALQGITTKTDAYDKSYRLKAKELSEAVANDAAETPNEEQGAANSQDDSEAVVGSDGVVSLQGPELHIRGTYGRLGQQTLLASGGAFGPPVEIEDERHELYKWLTHALHHETKEEFKGREQYIAFQMLDCNVHRMEGYLDDVEELYKRAREGFPVESGNGDLADAAESPSASTRTRADSKAGHRAYHIRRILKRAELEKGSFTTVESSQSMTYEEKEIIMRDLTGRIFRELRCGEGSRELMETLMTRFQMYRIRLDYYCEMSQFGTKIRSLYGDLMARTFAPYVPQPCEESSSEGDSDGESSKESKAGIGSASKEMPSRRGKSQDAEFGGSDCASRVSEAVVEAMFEGDSDMSTRVPSESQAFVRRWTKGANGKRCAMAATLELEVASAGIGAEHLRDKDEVWVKRLEEFKTPGQCYDLYDRTFDVLGHLPFAELKPLVEERYKKKNKEVIWMHEASWYTTMKHEPTCEKVYFDRIFAVVPKKMDAYDLARGNKRMYLPPEVTREFSRCNPLAGCRIPADLIPSDEPVFEPGLAWNDHPALMTWVKKRVPAGITAQGVPLLCVAYEDTWEAAPIAGFGSWSKDTGDSAKKSHGVNEAGDCGKGKTATEKWAYYRDQKPSNFVWADDADKIRAFAQRDDKSGPEGEELIDIGGRKVPLKNLVLYDSLSREAHTPELTAKQEKLVRLSINTEKIDDKVAVFSLLPRPKDPLYVWESYSDSAKARCIDECIQLHLVRLLRGCQEENYSPTQLNNDYRDYETGRQNANTKLGRNSTQSKHIQGRFEWAALQVDGAFLDLGCGCCGKTFQAYVVRPRDCPREVWMAKGQEGVDFWTRVVAEPSQVLEGCGEVHHHMQKYRHVENFSQKVEPYCQTGGQLGHGVGCRWGTTASPTARVPVSLLVMEPEENQEETPCVEQRWALKRGLCHVSCKEGSPFPDVVTTRQFLGNIGLQNRHVFEAMQTRKVKLIINCQSGKQTMEIDPKDIARVESGLVYWGTQALSQGYSPKGTRLVLARAMFPTAACWQEHTNHGIPDPLHPVPYEGEYDPTRPEPRALDRGLSKEVVPGDRDTVYKDDEAHTVWLPGDTLPTAQKDSSGRLTGEFARASAWTPLIVPRRGRPVIKKPSTNEDPECLRERAQQKPAKLQEVKTHDEYDEEGRSKRTAAYPPGDRHRGWWACSVLVPKVGTRLHTLTLNEVIVVCWVQQMCDGEWITAWTITATNVNTGVDRDIAGGWWAAPLWEEEDDEENDDV